MDSDYDSYCSDSTDYDSVSDDNYNDSYFDHDDDHDLLEEQDASVCRTHQLGYTVLKEAGIKQQQEDDISEVSSVLLLSRVEATILLRHYNWNVSKVHDEWFADEERVRRSVGLLEGPVVQFSNAIELTCGICFDSLPCDDFTSAACGHPFCQGCWEGYIHTIINDGPGCLSLRCPEPSCKAAVGQDMIDKLATCEDKEKYSRYLLKSYIEDNKKAKWCPAPGCENAVHITSGIENFDVSCICSHSFCWNCTEDAHRPVDCDTVNKWNVKNSSESENVTWIIVNSKPCPKCKLPIEKNQGCMHMVCRAPCKYEFCWLCLGAWSKHGERTGGFYACNSYEEAKRNGELDEDLKSRKRAKAALDKYTHYYERWASNQKSRQQALGSLHQMQTVHLDKLSDLQLTPKSQLKFITEAWLQIVECRRVLKWTYAYGYYFPEKEVARKHFFEHLQGMAESGLERLHQCAETKLNKFIYCDDASTENLNFDDLRSELIDLTRVTKNYFENLIEALENGLEDVKSEDARYCMKKTNSKNNGRRCR